MDLRISGGVIVSKLTLSVVGSGFEPQSDQHKDYKIGKPAVLRSKKKDWLSCSQDSVSMKGTTYLLAEFCFSELALFKISSSSHRKQDEL